MKTQIPCLFFFILILLCSSCFNAEKKEIDAVLDNRIKSFEQKDKDLYSNCIINTYNDITNSENIDKTVLIKNFEVNVSPFDKITFSKSNREIHINKTSAKVVIETSIDLSIQDKMTRYNTVEQINLSKENGEWKIVKESNLDLFRGFVFGEKLIN